MLNNNFIFIMYFPAESWNSKLKISSKTDGALGGWKRRKALHHSFMKESKGIHGSVNQAITQSFKPMDLSSAIVWG